MLSFSLILPFIKPHDIYDAQHFGLFSPFHHLFYSLHLYSPPLPANSFNSVTPLIVTLWYSPMSINPFI